MERERGVEREGVEREGVERGRRGGRERREGGEGWREGGERWERGVEREKRGSREGGERGGERCRQNHTTHTHHTWTRTHICMYMCVHTSQGPLFLLPSEGVMNSASASLTQHIQITHQTAWHWPDVLVS